MIVQPKVRGFICATAHPEGCARNVQEQIDFVRKQGQIAHGPQRALVIGASTGYGLASRILAAFGCGAKTMGVFFERPSDGRKTATAGWYNSVAFEQAAQEAGLETRSFNGDAFSREMKSRVVEAVRQDWGGVDLVVYSLASPRREHPVSGKVSRSVLKPCRARYSNKSMDFANDRLVEIALEPASSEEIQQTVDVMGGEDWEMWIDALDEAGLIADGFLTVAYSYVGPEITNSIYREGTIGAAKDHLEKTARTLDQRLSAQKAHAYVSVNKALVTQASSAIPFIPLYFTLLMKVMKRKGLHEDCIQQIYRLFSERLYTAGSPLVDSQGRIRIDDWEMREDVQTEVMALWDSVTEDNIHDIADIQGYHEDFLKLFGFGLKGVDYDADVDIERPIKC